MKEITDLQREMLKKYHLDAMVTMTPENITYVTGAYIPTQVTVRSRKVIHIITEKHDPVVIVVNIEEPIMRAQSWMDPKSIISYNEFTQNPMMIAIDKLKEFGMETKRIGMELSYLSAIDMDLMHKELPHAEIVNADAAYEEMRFIKMQFELDRIISFGSNIEEVIYGAFASARSRHDRKGHLPLHLQRLCRDRQGRPRCPCRWSAPACAAACSTASPPTRCSKRATSSAWT